MISEFEKHHGAVLRDVIVRAGSLKVSCCDVSGRVNCFSLEGNVGLHIKHSTSRLPPWQFTFDAPQVLELESIAGSHQSLWLALVCGDDGFLAVSFDEFQAINPPHFETTKFVRVDKSRNTMYRVFGTAGELGRRKPRGAASVVAAVRAGGC